MAKKLTEMLFPDVKAKQESIAETKEIPTNETPESSGEETNAE